MQETSEIIMDDHVYLLDTECLEDADIFRVWHDRMPPERKKKIDAYRFEKDRRLSLGAGIILQYGLGRAGASDAELSYGEHGKPLLAGREDVHFSLSHSGRMAAGAFSDRPVGIDIEKVRHFEDRLIRYVFREDEAARILASADSADEGFTALWTVKESLMKYFGTGITLEAKKIRVDLTEPVRAHCEGYSAGHLHFALYTPEEGYRLSVCSEHEHFPETGKRETLHLTRDQVLTFNSIL